ncbi:TonB family protein [Massilia sp. CCM 8733]|uniref:TonB family protein n=1 Tax=Massilia mucilaginosa TaxID=2609282 RepID=A0ABX0NL19_9BURK|nr:energy transducer TonB [Massilia mucilaginosa]NHZ87493.1 TonB family protein [Massilia mucilaginosa]
MKNRRRSFFPIILLAAFVCVSSKSFSQESEHPTHQADESARINLSTCTKPAYPTAALRKDEQGTVTLFFLIGPAGKVLESKVLRSSGSAHLDEAARFALEKCRFSPALVDGKPVEAWTKMQYVWTLTEKSPYFPHYF